jgi:superfamily II DNA or RNA helicase
MRWLEIEHTDIGMAFLESLIERPYLLPSELSLRLSLNGFDIPEEVVIEILEDPDSPFLVEPQRWYLDPAFVDVEDTALSDPLTWVDDDPQDFVKIAVIEGAEEFIEPDWLGPTRWIGPDLRPWQVDAFNAWVNSQDRGIVEAITGTGKTLVGAYAAAYVLDYGYKVVITVPTLDLMDQWINQLESCIAKVVIGRLGDKLQDSIEDVDVLVSTINSGSRHFMRSEHSETLLIADEVHRMGSPQFSLALEEEIVARLGLTATLERNNDNGVDEILMPYFEDIVYSYGYADALADGVLAPFKLAFVAADFTPDELEEYNTLGTEMGRLSHQLRATGLINGNDSMIFAQIGSLAKQNGPNFRAMLWAQKFMANLGKRRKLQASATNKIVAVQALTDVIALSERSLIFTETKDAASSIARMLRTDGINSESFDSGLNRAERSERLTLFKEGGIQALCAPRVLDEGIDIPQVDVGVIVSASQSRRQMIQRLGRIVRPNQTGRPSTLFLLYLRGTREDPNEGGHEGFLEEVLPYAAEVVTFDALTDPDVIARWYQS